MAGGCTCAQSRAAVTESGARAAPVLPTSSETPWSGVPSCSSSRPPASSSRPADFETSKCHASQDAHSALGSAVKGQVEALEGASSRPSELMEIHETTPPRCPLASNSPLEAVASCKQDLLAPSTWPLRSIHGRCVNVLSVTRLWQLWQTYHIRQSLLEHILGTKQCKQRSVKIATGGGL